jgi:uncharacterized protein YciI
MKHFLVEVNYAVPLEQIDAVLAEHRAFLQTGYDRGLLLMSGPLNPRSGGRVVVRAESLDEIRAFFARDPYNLKSLATYAFYEFEPVKRQPFMDDWISGK